MSVVIDTCVWVDHFRYRNDVLIKLLQTDLALTHRMVLVELACGTPPSPRTTTLGEIALLRSCNQASLDEVINLIEREKPLWAWVWIGRDDITCVDAHYAGRQTVDAR